MLVATCPCALSLATPTALTAATGTLHTLGLLLTRGHVGVDIVPMMVDGTRRRILYLLGSLIALFFCSLFFYAAIPWWCDAWQTGQTTATIWRARLWVPYACVPIGLGVLCLQYATEIYLVLTGREEPYGLSPGVNL